MQSYKKHAFTLIELLMVIAIIGILAAILIPVVGIVKDRANIAASKMQLSNFISAISQFKGEYNYYPFPDTHAAGGASIPTIGEAEFLAELGATTLSGDKLTYTQVTSNNYGNRKLISFYDFSEDNFREGDSTTGEIADRFNNTNIFIAIDGDGDGQIEGLPDPEGDENKIIRAKVTAYVLNDTETPNTPDYYLYD